MAAANWTCVRSISPFRLVAIRTTIANAAAAALFYSGIYHLLGPAFRGAGCVFALHKVVTAREWNQFGPMNRYLSISEELFEAMIHTLMDLDYEIVTMSQISQRLNAGRSDHRFACFTFDDGYRDNYEVAFRISRKHNVPIVIYLATGMVDRITVEPWRGIESLIAARDKVRVPAEAGGADRFEEMRADTEQTKTACCEHLSRVIAAAPAERKNRLLTGLGEENGFDAWGPIQSLSLDWALVRSMQESGLVEFGAHTVRHLSLASLSSRDAADEMLNSANRVAAELGTAVRHFSYPYGTPAHAGEREFRICRELGFETGVTTRHGTLTLAHRNAMQSLPRLTLNGHVANLCNVKVFASGAMTPLESGWRFWRTKS